MPIECNDVSCFNELSANEQKSLLDWISENIKPGDNFNPTLSSYGLKHLFENSENGFYITNGAFKGAMLKRNYFVKNRFHINWIFNISEKSNCFKL